MTRRFGLLSSFFFLALSATAMEAEEGNDELAISLLIFENNVIQARWELIRYLSSHRLYQTTPPEPEPLLLAIELCQDQLAMLKKRKVAIKPMWEQALREAEAQVPSGKLKKLFSYDQ